jgi:2-polyprenyl-3-methyl-5-hydroxy-6-metoxy-1,4-benzoquinol methylase
MNDGSGVHEGYVHELSPEEIDRYRSKASHAVQTEGESWRQCGVVAGATVADLGCGPGAVLAELASRVGAEGKAVGVDADPAAVAAARAMTASRGLANVEVIQADAGSTGLRAGGFDVVMIRNVLIHAGQRISGLVEHAASLVRDSGCLYLAEIDGTAVRYDRVHPGLADLFRRFEEFLVKTRGADLAIGPKLGSILRDAGLEVIVQEAFFQTLSPVPDGLGPWSACKAMIAAGFATPGDLKRWEEGIRVTASDPGSVVFTPTFSAAGRRPSGVSWPQRTLAATGGA